MDDPKFKYFQEKVISILDSLEKQENSEKKEVKKSLLEAEEMAKGGKGLPVGTVREWKGKKYVKIAPKKWKPKYDDAGRGAKMAIAAIKKKASACTTSQELLQLVQEYRDRFSDKNGHPLPIVKELSDYVSKRNDEIESGSREETPTERAVRIYDEYKENLEKMKAEKEEKAKSAEQKKESSDSGKDIDSIYEKQLNRIKELKKKGKSDSEIDNDKIVKETKADMKKINEKLDEKKTVNPEDKKLSNGKTIKEMREKYGIKVDDNSKEESKIDDKGQKKAVEAIHFVNENKMHALAIYLANHDNVTMATAAIRLKAAFEKLGEERVLSKFPKEILDKYHKESGKNKVTDKSPKDIKNMSDEELDSEIKRLDEEKEELSKKATELYDKNSGWWRGLEKDDELPGSDYQKWNKLRAEVQDRMHDAAELAIERGKRKAAKNKDSKSTFVNGYGEATTREITSQTYKRQQKRLENDVLRNMGVKKSITLLVSKSLTNFILEDALDV